MGGGECPLSSRGSGGGATSGGAEGFAGPWGWGVPGWRQGPVAVGYITVSRTELVGVLAETPGIASRQRRILPKCHLPGNGLAGRTVRKGLPKYH